MKQMNLSTRQLRAFLALAELRSFTRAAQRLHLSQPAFSALIRALESDLGQTLFARTTRHVELTPEGESFEVGARRVLAEAERTLADARDLAERRRGRVAVALLPSLAAGWLPGVLAGFGAEHPGIEVSVADVLSESCLEAVRSGRADLAIAAIRADTPELRAEPFCTDAFHLVCPEGHPLARLRAPRPRDVAAHPFVHLSRTTSVRPYIDAAVAPLQLDMRFEVDQLATVMGMVRAGLGVSVVPALTLFHFRQPGVVVRPLAWPGLRRRLYLVRRRDRPLSIAAQALLARMRAQRPVAEGAAAPAPVPTSARRGRRAAGPTSSRAR